METPPVLSAQHISHSFRASNGSNVLAISNISLSVTPNTFTCLVGPSGSGKTTLLRVLAGLVPPEHGEVQVQGTLLRGPRRSMSIVAQKENLMPWRSVLQNVMLPLQLAGVKRSERVARARHMLEVTGLTEFENVYPAELSGGMAQRVSIARGMVTEPDILLLDEPFGALDAITREQMWHELLRLWRRTHAAVLMVTHDIREAVFLADRVLVLSPRPGRIVGDIDINFDRPRKMSLLTNAEFVALEARVRDCIRY